EIEKTSQEREYVEDAESQSEEFVRTELDKVVRNSMHYRLQEQLRLLKDSGEAIDVQRHPQAMIQLATEKLVRDMRVQARDEAVCTFRNQRPENCPLTACFVCYANEELQTNDMSQFMAEGSAHVCARTSGSDLVTIGMEFNHLKMQELEYEHQL
uniref:Uncharacterized protein n=1 Tax=Globisporangium ultimum (strain ATCC 200006 / CBS 805.95 / DAOM BR144) TaxID=431595 RepID=K3W9D1_GLOUD